MPMITDQSPITFADPLPEAADVVVIGGGVAGIAAAYFLAERGEKVVVCEKGRVAGEQSSRNWGWIRQQGRDRAELPIMMESNRIWRGLAEKTGESDLTFTQCGNLYITDDEATLRKYEAWREMATEHQLDTKMLSKADITDQYPGIKGNWVGGMITPSDGRGEPFVAIPALARAARQAGAVIAENCAVRTLDVEGGKVAGVVTEAGRIRCDRVLLASGAWSTHFAANAGIDLPQLAVRSTVARTEPVPEFVSNNVLTPGLSIRRRADGGYTITSGELAEHFLSPKSFKYFTKFFKLLRTSAKNVKLHLGAPKGYPGAWGSPTSWSADEESPFERMRVLNPDPSPIVVKQIYDRLPNRYPAMKDAKLAEAWAGMIDVTPDAVPVLGEDHRLPGLHIATGLSGHGFGIGPAIGRIAADLLSGRDPGYDLTRFRTQRFFDGTPLEPGPY